MMRPQKVLEYLDMKPFRPFRVKMASGQSFDVRHPEMMLVGPSTARVFTATEPGEHEKWHEISLMLIEILEPLDVPVTQANS